MEEDALSKRGLHDLLSPFVEVRLQHPVHPPAQFVDVFVASQAHDPAAMWRTLGWLGRMASHVGLIEAFSRAVPEPEAWACLRKQLNLHHEREQQAHPDSPADPGGAEPARLPLWMLSNGQPRTLLAAWPFTREVGWPRGFYTLGPALQVYVVVLTELPRTRETLPLRLFGSDALRWDVAQELKRLPEDDPLRQGLRPMLYRWSVWLRGQPEDETKRRLLMDLDQLVQEDIRKLRAEGRTEALREATLDLCEVLGVEVNEARRVQLAALDLPQLEDLRRTLKQQRTWPT